MSESIPITVSLTESEWISAHNAWYCNVVHLPGVQITDVRIDGRSEPHEFVELDQKAGVIKWRRDATHPKQITLFFDLQKSLDIGAKWKKFAILVPIIVAIIAPLLTTLVKYPGSTIGWGAIWDKGAQESFLGGPSAERLKGQWSVELFDEKGNPWKVGDKVYKGEMLECRVNKSLVSMRAIMSDGGATYLWGEGRLAPGDTITLVTWPQLNVGQERIVSVNLLKLKPESNPLQLEGIRVGVDRKGAVVQGKIVYTKASD